MKVDKEVEVEGMVDTAIWGDCRGSVEGDLVREEGLPGCGQPGSQLDDQHELTGG